MSNMITPLKTGELDSTSFSATLSSFTVNTHFEDLPNEVVQRLKELLLDWIGVTSAASTGADSSDPITKGVLSFMGGVGGTNTVLNRGQCYNAQTAALLNGAFSHTFDFDDTFARGCLHPGTSVVAATLAQAEEQKSTSADVLTALAIGYEVVCRISIQLGDQGYQRGFHITGTAGIFGCVAAISSLRHLSADVVENAFGLAGSKAAGSMQFLENGSWNKRLHPGFAAHDALLCVALADARVIGSSKCFDGRWGVFHAYSGRPSDTTQLLLDLGQEWEFMTTALKPFPACRMTHGAIDLVGQLAQSSGKESFQHIEVRIWQACVDIVGVNTPNKVHPRNIVDAQFSMYYQVAVAWLYGSWTGWAAYDKLNDPKIHELCDKITVVADPSISDLKTRLNITWEDGKQQQMELLQPMGEDNNPFDKARIDAKFLSLASPVYGQQKAAEILRAVDNLETKDIAAVMYLLK